MTLSSGYTSGERVTVTVSIAECRRGAVVRGHNRVVAFDKQGREIRWTSSKSWRVGYSTVIRGTVWFWARGATFLQRVAEVDG